MEAYNFFVSGWVDILYTRTISPDKIQLFQHGLLQSATVVVLDYKGRRGEQADYYTVCSCDSDVGEALTDSQQTTVTVMQGQVLVLLGSPVTAKLKNQEPTPKIEANGQSRGWWWVENRGESEATCASSPSSVQVSGVTAGAHVSGPWWAEVRGD
ncbi:hypothetical protein Bbelb_415910 [Branchiostoma belcheri]|nr:hypothetical protein Bbelb_415910 [Branchiostoma belcheri]